MPTAPSNPSQPDDDEFLADVEGRYNQLEAVASMDLRSRNELQRSRARQLLAKYAKEGFFFKDRRKEISRLRHLAMQKFLKRVGPMFQGLREEERR